MGNASLDGREGNLGRRYRHLSAMPNLIPKFLKFFKFHKLAISAPC